MSRTSILAILASAGVLFSGVITADSEALARAILSGDSDQLNRFAKQFPDSEYREDAIRLAASENCTVNWVGGDCGLNPLPIAKPRSGPGPAGGGGGIGETPAPKFTPPPPVVVYSG
jgi:hypothetical protein